MPKEKPITMEKGCFERNFFELQEIKHRFLYSNENLIKCSVQVTHCCQIVCPRERKRGEWVKVHKIAGMKKKFIKPNIMISAFNFYGKINASDLNRNQWINLCVSQWQQQQQKSTQCSYEYSANSWSASNIGLMCRKEKIPFVFHLTLHLLFVLCV